MRYSFLDTLSLIKKNEFLYGRPPRAHPMRTIEKGLILLSIPLYLAALCTPSVEEFNLLDSHPEVLPGYLVFIWGWYALMFLHPAWFANVTWIICIALFFKKKHKALFIISVLTLLLSIDSYLYPSHHYIGFYLWNISINLPLIVSILHWATLRSRKPIAITN